MPRRKRSIEPLTGPCDVWSGWRSGVRTQDALTYAAARTNADDPPGHGGNNSRTYERVVAVGEDGHVLEQVAGVERANTCKLAGGGTCIRT